MNNIVEMLLGLLGDHSSAELENLHVAIPGRVESYDSTKQRATVQPAIKRAHIDEAGNRVVEALPPIPDVPVVFPGGGGYRLTFPIQRGDGVLLVFSEASMDKWLAKGGVVDPVDDRRHDLTDAIAVPGLRSFATPLTDVPTDGISLGVDAGGLELRITGSEIRAGGTERLVTKAEFDTHTHPAPGGATSAPTAAATGTAFLRGFVVLGLALVLSAIACAYLLGRVS